MLIPRLVAGVGLAAATILAAVGVSAQDYPNKPVRIVTGTAGGGIDFAARVFAQGLTPNLGQQVIVDNRPSGVIPGQLVSKALPNGYTLLAAGGTLLLGPLLEKTPYDPIKDFAPISIIDRSPNVIVVHPSVPVTSVKELIALAKAKPGELNYASSATGAASHLAAEFFKAMAGVNIVRIPYKGGGPALNDVIAGQVQMMFASANFVVPHVKSGRVRALAVTSSQPSALFPSLPTVEASGLPGYESVSIDFLLAPVRTPAAVIRRLNQGAVQVLNQADVKEKFMNIGVEAVSSLPEELAAKMKSDMASVSKLIKDGAITVD